MRNFDPSLPKWDVVLIMFSIGVREAERLVYN